VEEESRDNDGQEEAEVIEETGRDDDVEQAQEQTTNDENDADELVFRHHVHCLYKRLGTARYIFDIHQSDICYRNFSAEMLPGE